MNHFDCSSHPELKTDRIILRCISADDSPVIYAMRQVEETARLLDWPVFTHIYQACEYVMTRRQSIDKSECYYWIIVMGSTGEAVGTICLWNLSDDGCQAELGYELLPEFQGKGIMTEAVMEVLRFAFNEGGFRLIEALPYSINKSSVALLERLNFKFEGTYDIVHTNPNAVGLRYVMAKSDFIIGELY